MASLPRLTVLIVDDSPSVLAFLRSVLESAQFDVLTASDGRDGLAQARQSPPDLVVTDSVMPGMDGHALLRALREDAATAAIPVIMLTSLDPEDPQHAAREPRPDAFVKKSADFGPLLAEVRAALGRG